VSWTRAAVVAGLLLLCVGFWFGVESRTTTLDGREIGCEQTIPLGWLMSGADDGGSPGAGTAQERRVEARCEATGTGRALLTWGLVGGGGLLALAGWTVARDREESLTPPRHPQSV
jgi:hypothetical protein